MEPASPSHLSWISCLWCGWMWRAMISITSVCNNWPIIMVILTPHQRDLRTQEPIFCQTWSLTLSDSCECAKTDVKNNTPPPHPQSIMCTLIHSGTASHTLIFGTPSKSSKWMRAQSSMQELSNLSSWPAPLVSWGRPTSTKKLRSFFGRFKSWPRPWCWGTTTYSRRMK